MKIRRIEAFNYGVKQFEYYSETIPTLGSYIDFNGSPWQVYSVEHTIKYGSLIGIKIGVK